MNKYIPTYEEVKKAVKQIKEWRENKTCIVGPYWYFKTSDLEHILQEWRSFCLENKKEFEFEIEYQYIHDKSTYNWHMYEEGSKYI